MGWGIHVRSQMSLGLYGIPDPSMRYDRDQKIEINCSVKGKVYCITDDKMHRVRAKLVHKPTFVFLGAVFTAIIKLVDLAIIA